MTVLSYVKYTDGSQRVYRGVAPYVTPIGYVGKDENGWWARWGEGQRSLGSVSLAFFFQNAFRTRKLAVEALLNWHTIREETP